MFTELSVTVMDVCLHSHAVSIYIHPCKEAAWVCISTFPFNLQILHFASVI